MITDKNYKEEFKEGYSVVEVGGGSCANCITLMPILNKICNQMSNVKLFTIEASDETRELCNFYEVEAIPTILLIYNGNLLGKVRGFQPEEILQIWLETKIEDNEKLMKKL